MAECLYRPNLPPPPPKAESDSGTDKNAQSFWDSQLHMRCELVEVHLVDGPGRGEAIVTFTEAVLLRLVELTTDKQNVVHELVI